MTVQCKLCGYFAPGLLSYISHLRLVHGEDQNFHIYCGIDGCEQRQWECLLHLVVTGIIVSPLDLTNIALLLSRYSGSTYPGRV